eukprot:7067857-Karenia_brevis.AAC.1
MLMLVSTSQSTDFDKLKPAMIEQHARIEHAPKPSAPKFQPKRSGRLFRKNLGHITAAAGYWNGSVDESDPAGPYEAA